MEAAIRHTSGIDIFGLSSIATNAVWEKLEVRWLFSGLVSEY
jgi:hypothetical protein